MEQKPKWLIDHPSAQIFNYFNSAEILVGQIWFRPIDLGFEIDYLEVKDEFRGQGHAQQMLHAFLAECRSKQKFDFEIWLEVSELNIKASKAYKSFGFEQVGQRPRYYADHSDALVLSLKISE